MKKFKVFIDGQEGTTGLKIFERFAGRNDVELQLIDESKRKDKEERKKFINNSDIVFVCLPDDAARESVSFIENEKVKVIDASTAHRTIEGWVYGFPELSSDQRKAIEKSNRVAVAGCHASGFLSIVAPLVRSGLVPADYPFVCSSLTGFSGGGKKMIAEYENLMRPIEFDSPRMYGLSQTHKHLKEMQFVAGLKFPPIFCPIVSGYFSGMQTIVPIETRLLEKKMTANTMFDFLSAQYEKQTFVKVCKCAEKDFLACNSLSGTNMMEIVISGNDERIVISSLFDNLGKGASGSAVQCMNIMLGLDETTSLL